MSEIDRREFFQSVGKACAGMAVLPAVVSAEAAEAQPPAEQALYRGRALTQIAMPMGGLGAGNVAMGGRGNLRNWQIFNVCNPGAQLPGSFFAVWAKAEGGTATAKLLQLEPVGRLPMVDDVEFAGEYPFAWLTYKDSSLPVQIGLEACCPLVPMNAKDSGLPGVAFRFHLKNAGPQPVSVSLAQTCRNAVGFDGIGSYDEAVGNLNRHEQRDGLHLLYLTAGENAQGPAVSRPVVALTDSHSVAQTARFFGNVDLRFRESLAKSTSDLKPADVARIAVQRGTPPPGKSYGPNDTFDTVDAPVVVVAENLTPGGLFTDLEAFVAAGGRLVITGDPLALLNGTLANTSTPVTTEVFDDFEGATYDPARWTVEGTAFGSGPAHGTLPGQQAVSGFQGQGLVNSFLNGDGPTGKMTSKPFKINRRYIHFLIGGGHYAGETCMNLRVNGAVARTATGKDEELLHAERWDVGDLNGQMGVLEIVDARSDGWGHINIDQIVFSDDAAVLPVLTPADRQRVRDFLPFTFASVSRGAALDTPTGDTPLLRGIVAASVQMQNVPTFTGLSVKPDVSGVTPAGAGKDRLYAAEWQHGKGRVVMLLTGVEDWFTGSPTALQDRRALLGNVIARAAGADFAPGTGMSPTHPQWGSLALATSAADVSWKEQWDALDEFWSDFSDDGKLMPSVSGAALPGKTWNGALAAHVDLKPGEEKDLLFWLAWHFPNRYRDRSYDVGWGANVAEYEVKHRLGNRYNQWFKSAPEVVAYLAANQARLRSETQLYHSTLYDSTLPRVLLDAVSSQVSILRSQTSMWLEDGRWMAYEGLGCCPMNCTHVYNYAQVLAKLFPELERDVRRTDFTVQLQDDGGVRHRVQLPLTAPRVTGPFTDGHLSTISKAYREHRQSPDMAFLDEFWPAIKKAMDFAIREYDKSGNGVIDGKQPNTYDCEVNGPNSFITTQYLAALRAAEEMAKEMKEPAYADRCRALFEKGSHNLDTICWNGEYYQQSYPDYLTTPTQYGPGCLADQVLGQWWAHVNGLGYLLPKDRIRTALQSLLKYNFVPDFTTWDNHGQRVFANGRDQGLVCCTWPHGGRPEKVTPILYSDEVWTGIEYQVAAHMLYEGMTTEGLKIVAALRARYDGVKRNPWNEIECSDHYGRAMASWSALLAASGYDYHGPKGILSFAPRLQTEDFRALFSGAAGWGSFSQTRPAGAAAGRGERKEALQQNAIHLAYGALTLNEVRLPIPQENGHPHPRVAADVDGHRLPASAHRSDDALAINVRFRKALTLSAGQTLRILLS